MPAKKVSQATLEKLTEIARDYAAFSTMRKTIEHEIRLEVQRRLDAQEAEVAAKVLRAMQNPEITNAALMRAIGKQNPDRWKAWLAKWSENGADRG